MIPYVATYGKQMVRNFYDYWTERTPGGKKMRFETTKCFQISKRLSRWSRNNFDHHVKKETLRETENRNIQERNLRERDTRNVGSIAQGILSGTATSGGYQEYFQSLKKRAEEGDEKAIKLLLRHLPKEDKEKDEKGISEKP